MSNPEEHEITTRCAPRWAWDAIDDALDTWGDITTKAALRAMVMASERADDTTVSPDDVPEPREWRINVAQDIRAYGSVTVTAPTLAEAVALVDHVYVLDNFNPHGSGADDFDHANARAVCLTEAEDEDGTTFPLDIELPDDPDPTLARALELLRQAIASDADDDGDVTIFADEHGVNAVVDDIRAFLERFG